MKLDERIHALNMRVAHSAFGKWFRLEGSGARRERVGSLFSTEIRAGLATFFAMAYIISVNATIAGDSGGTCVCNGTADDPVCDANPEYSACLEIVHRDLVTATAAISCLTTFCMGLFANMPIGLAPGMGLNAYFAYQVVGYHGSGSVSFELALTAVFVEGWIFIGLSLLGIRQWLARSIPTSIKLATGAGIGLYLTLIGLYGSAGLGVVTGATSTPVDLSGCDAQYASDPDLCSQHQMTSKTMWLGIFCGGFVTGFLMLYRVKGAIIAGIALVSIISWPRTTPVTYFPYDDAGQSRFDFFKHVVAFHKIEKLLTVQEWNIGSIPGGSGHFWLALVTFLYVDILDCTGTLYSMAKFSGAMDKKTGDFEGSAVAYLVDAGGIVVGSLLGTSPVTAYIESGAGISEGGKTGITAMVTGLCFFVSLFFAPIFASIPPWATGSTLIIVGSMMMSAVTEINWTYFGDAMPAFLTIAIMPFTYSIAYGLIAGIITYIILNTGVWIIDKVSGGRITPENYDKRDGWSWHMAVVEEDDLDSPAERNQIKGFKGFALVFLPPWAGRLLIHKQKRFWEPAQNEVIDARQNSTGNDETVIEVQSESSKETNEKS
ncbi:permease family-domain-containing protein [Lipomyces arxii]|uniref:permease family-domain-containing protein n=1 Tax=Lipomyces arxii TaxID=56418 RepID=UPI0034CE10E4